MNTEIQPRLRLDSLLLTVAAMLSLTGCMMVKSSADVVGEYNLKVGANEIELNLSPDNTFSERITWQNGRVQTYSGKWAWGNGGIRFHQLWIPPEFAPQYILQADGSSGQNKQPKYTEPAYWFIRPEKHWGKVILSVFPDADTEFEMVSHAAE